MDSKNPTVFLKVFATRVNIGGCELLKLKSEIKLPFSKFIFASSNNWLAIQKT